MEPNDLISVTCDRLEEFEEDASSFASDKPEFISEYMSPKKDVPKPSVASVPLAPAQDAGTGEQLTGRDR